MFVRFLNILLAGIIAGALLIIWIGYNPGSLSSATYVEQQQSAIRSLNSFMPALGLVTILLTILSAIQQKADKPIFITLITAAVFLIIGGLVTRFGNQPINSIMMGWKMTEVPSDWTSFRDKWWSLHKIRAITSIIAFCLIVWAGMRRS